MDGVLSVFVLCGLVFIGCWQEIGQQFLAVNVLLNEVHRGALLGRISNAFLCTKVAVCANVKIVACENSLLTKPLTAFDPAVCQ